MEILFILTTDIWIISLGVLQILVNDIEYKYTPKCRFISFILCGVFVLALVLSVSSFATLPNLKTKIICAVISFGILIFLIGITVLIILNICKRADKRTEMEDEK